MKDTFEDTIMQPAITKPHTTATPMGPGATTISPGKSTVMGPQFAKPRFDGWE